MPERQLGFADVTALLDAAVGGSFVYVGEHEAFWRGRTRDEFVATGPIRGVTPVVVGNSDASGLVQALRGAGVFGNGPGKLPRMPLDGPYMAADDIDAIAAWIDAGCPDISE